MWEGDLSPDYRGYQRRRWTTVLNQAKREVKLIIPMYPNMELTAAQTASCLAGLMDFDENQIDEIQFAIIETCINAFEHSKSRDNKVFINFIMRNDELELEIRDCGVGFGSNQVTPSKMTFGNALKKRGWGIEIIRNIMDTVNVQSGEKGTIVTMIKRKTARK